MAEIAAAAAQIGRIDHGVTPRAKLRHEDVGTGESVGWRAACAAGKRGLESAGRRREVGRVSPTDNIGVAPGIDGETVQEKVAEVFVAAATQVGGVS